MGRPRKPAAIRRLEGTGHRPIPEEQQGIGTARPPMHFSEDQRLEWDATVAFLPYRSGSDADMIERHVLAKLRRRKLEAEIARTGEVVVDGKRGLIPNPRIRSLNQTLRELDRTTRELGLSPQARANIGFETRPVRTGPFTIYDFAEADLIGMFLGEDDPHNPSPNAYVCDDPRHSWHGLLVGDPNWTPPDNVMPLDEPRKPPEKPGKAKKKPRKKPVKVVS